MKTGVKVIYINCSCTLKRLMYKYILLCNFTLAKELKIELSGFPTVSISRVMCMISFVCLMDCALPSFGVFFSAQFRFRK